MRKIILASFFVVACNQSTGIELVRVPDIECVFHFSVEPICLYKTDKDTIRVTLLTKKLAENEIALTHVQIFLDGKKHTFSISSDVSMVEGDIGIISFADINFDHFPDIAVSTSFSVANQYFDYWVFDPKNGKYHLVGNYPKLSMNSNDKTLKANVKLNAANYQLHKYSWNGNKLTRIK